MDRSDASDLADLKFHWGEVYAIGYGNGMWSAFYRGSRDEFHAESASDLREKIRADYRRRPTMALSDLHERMST